MNIENIKSIRKSLGDDLEKEKQLFTNEEIEAEWEKTNNVNLCLYHLYLQKAGRLITNETYIKSIKAGNEELERLNALDLQNMALKQAEEYKRLYEWEIEVNEASKFIY